MLMQMTSAHFQKYKIVTIVTMEKHLYLTGVNHSLKAEMLNKLLL